MKMSEYPLGQVKIGECSYCGGSVTVDHRCPAPRIRLSDHPSGSDIHKTMREQVISAIANEVRIELDKDYEITGVTGIFEAADAAIQAVREGMRCGRCEYLKQYSTIVGRNRSIYFCELQQFDATVHGHDAPDNFGCISWKEK